MTRNRTTKNPSISSACKVNTNITVPNNLIRGNTIVRHVTEDFGGQYRVVKLGSSLSRTSKIWNSVNGGQQMFMVQPGRRSNSNNNNEKGGAAKNVHYLESEFADADEISYSFPPHQSHHHHLVKRSRFITDKRT